jgi:signal transduction histidine kinase
MTRRLTITILAVVTGALLVAGLGTLLLVRLDDRRVTRRELAAQATRTADAIEQLRRAAPNAEAATRRLAGLALIQRVLKLDSSGVVRVGPASRGANLPAGVSLADLDATRLAAGTTVSGFHGTLVYAAAPLPGVTPLAAVVLTRHVGGTRGVGLWLVVASALALAVAAAVAIDLGRRLTRPLRDAEVATQRIASGDLAARVPVADDSDDEVALLARSINAMAEGLERSRGLERHFLLSVSHDLRTPLTSIRGYAEAIAEARAPDPAQAAAVIGTEARRLERLVGDLLELAKLDARQFSLDVRATDVVEVATDVVEGFRPAAEDAGLTVEMRASSDGDSAVLALAAADPDRLAQVVANLVENALKFAHTTIAVGVTAGGQAVVLWVDDDGPGIAPDDLPRVFDRFFTAYRAPTRQVGSGLGLAIVRELVDAMGGAVRAETGPTGGTRMVVTLRPWSPAPQPGPDAATGAASSSSRST